MPNGPPKRAVFQRRFIAPGPGPGLVQVPALPVQAQPELTRPVPELPARGPVLPVP